MPDSHPNSPHEPTGPQPLNSPEPQPHAGASAERARWQEHLRNRLLIQCTASQAGLASELVADHTDSGLVLTGSDAPKIARSLQAQGFHQPILCDAERYKGNNRDPAGTAFDRQWIAWQRRLGGPVLTDSGYVGEGDLPGLRSILSQAARVGDDVIACLPLHLSWLKNPGRTAVLREEISDHNVPVALVLEHNADPLGVQAALRGLLRLLTTQTPVLLLRSDVSALGALCFGALATAVGTTSGLRHLYPARPQGGNRPPSDVSILVRHCLSYVRVDKVASAVQLVRDQAQHWECSCGTCSGREMDYFSKIPDKTYREKAAFCHSAELMLEIRDELFLSRLTPAQRRDSWIESCNAAESYHDEINRFGPMYRDWKVPRFLKHWRTVGAEIQGRDLFHPEARPR